MKNGGELDADRFHQDWQLKARNLEQEIYESASTATQKANMLHSLSKLAMFAADEGDCLRQVIQRLKEKCGT